MVDDLDAALATCANSGGEIVQQGQSGASKFAYLDTQGGPGTLLEILAASAEVIQYQGYMKDCAKSWNGTQPIRSFGT